ncbi:MAG TPA: hypothetical protein VKA46_02455 [Gemmataceae bacterium]|nr:hypothetical protein [Gemmataceae bacterium]
MTSILTLRSADDIPEGLPPSQERCLRAYFELKPTIDRTYPRGHFVAFYDGQLAGDAAESHDLAAALDGAGKDSQKVLIVEAGAEELRYVLFRFLQTMR